MGLANGGRTKSGCLINDGIVLKNGKIIEICPRNKAQLYVFDWYKESITLKSLSEESNQCFTTNSTFMGIFSVVFIIWPYCMIVQIYTKCFFLPTLNMLFLTFPAEPYKTVRFHRKIFSTAAQNSCSHCGICSCVVMRSKNNRNFNHFSFSFIFFSIFVPL